jgi:hypothetical protein
MTESHPRAQNAPSRAADFVGRDEEFDQLRVALDKSLSGEGEVCSLTGEPGIGKTRLASEFAQSARRRGALVLWSRCASLDVPSSWPWIQVSRAYLQSGGDYLAGEMREILESFAKAADHSDSQRFGLFDRVAGTLRSVARNRPLLLVFDDLQAIDQLSLTLLSFVARELSHSGVLILILYREPDVRTSLVGRPQWQALVSEVSRHLVVRHLTPLSIGDLIRQLTQRIPEPELVEAFRRKTAGNPRLIETIISCGLVDWQRNRIEERTPAELRLAVEHHLGALAATTRELLATASVIGLSFDVTTVQLASGRELDQILDAMAEGEGAGVLQCPDPVSGQYQFEIEVIRDVLRESLSGANRERLHNQIAEALETLYHRGASVALDQVAYHFAKGAALGQAGKAVEYARRSASQAMRRGAFHDAARLYALALAAAEFVPHYDEAKRWDLLIAQASSQSRSQDLAGARVSYEHALELAERLGDPERAALASLGVSQMADQNGRDTSPAKSAENSEVAQAAYLVGEGSTTLSPLRAKSRALGNSVVHERLPVASARDARPAVFTSTGELAFRGERSGLPPLTETTQIPERTFRREGEYWTISYEGRVIRMKHSKGLAFIAHLLGHPGREFHVTDIIPLAHSEPGGAVDAKARDSTIRSDLGDAGPALDATSKSSYRQRLRDLREELDEAISARDSGKAAKVQEEMEFLSQELARAVGLGGRDRKISSEAERARLRVTNAIRSAIRKIAKQHSALGRYLAISLRTGSICSFEPAAGSPGAWHLFS